MPANEEEMGLLRSAALKNANSILIARQRRELEMLRSKEALELKSAELAVSLSKIRATLESTNDGILVTNAQGQITDHNKRFLAMWGISGELPSSLHHRQVLEIGSSRLADSALYTSTLNEIYSSWPQETFDILEFADGRVFERFSRVQTVSGEPIGRVWSYRDVTERKRSEQALRDQSEWFSVTLGSIGDGVITVDTERKVTFLNQVAEKHTGWTISQAIGRPIGDVMRIVNETTRAPTPSPIDTALSEGKIVGLANHTILISRSGNETPIEDSAAPIKNLAGTIIGAVMVFQDVSEKRQKESALARVYETEQQARGAAEQANSAKDHFLAVLSHELRTPLTPVIAILETLAESSSIPPALAADLVVIRRNIELEARLIDDLLDLTRISRGKLELQSGTFVVTKLIEDAVSICESGIEDKHLTLVREFGTGSETIVGDGVRITQILWNLLKNSIKFTPAGGSITIRTSLRLSNQGKQVAIEVQDTGIGIAPDQIGGLFQAFEQGSRSVTQNFGGLGLGLAISKAITDLHNGSISAASPGPGQGCTVTVLLPCISPGTPKAKPAAQARAVASPFPAGNRKLRILLVEDHADTAMVIARLLRAMGHFVVHAPNLEQALAAADREIAAGGLDIVVSDVGLPDGSGLEMMRILSSKHGLRGIAISGFGMDSDVAKSKAAGFVRHLTKPVDVKLLRQTVTEVGDTL